MLSRQVRRLVGSWLFATAVTFPAQAAMAGGDPIQEAALQIERTLKATVGYSIHDTGTGRSRQYRADERFPMASTVKLLLCSTLLNEGQALMTRSVPIHSQDILAYAPVTKDRSARMYLRQNCAPSPSKPATTPPPMPYSRSRRAQGSDRFCPRTGRPDHPIGSKRTEFE